jgi:hypothetical protein
MMIISLIQDECVKTVRLDDVVKLICMIIRDSIFICTLITYNNICIWYKN